MVNIDSEEAALIRDTKRKMASLATELRRLTEATSFDVSDEDDTHNADIVVKVKGEGLEHSGVEASKNLNRKMHKTCKALLAIYDELGPMALADTIISIRLAAKNENPQKHVPKFDKNIKAIFAKHLGNSATAADNNTKSRRVFLIAAASALVSGAFVARNMYGESKMDAENERVQRRIHELNELDHKSFDQIKGLPMEQFDKALSERSKDMDKYRQELFELQTIQLPRIQDAEGDYKNSRSSQLVLTVSLVIAALFFSKKSRKGGDVKSMIGTIDQILQDACKETGAESFYVPPKDERGKSR
jgi:hypothetical protein